MKIFYISKNIFFLLLLSILQLSCGDNSSESDFTAEFSYEFIDGNNVKFTNESSGEYYSMTWDFGNDSIEVTTDKKQQFKVYYPKKGEYTVSLKLSDYSGNIKTTQEKIIIDETDFSISFTAEISQTENNKVTLTNTSQGEFDSFKWSYRHFEIENQNPHVAYFPFSGKHKIILTLYKNNEVFSLEKNINITSDDPDYFNNLKLIWSDEFDGSEINTSVWDFETGSSGWGNNELQNYTDGENAELKDGKLVITAKKINNNTEVGSFTSSRINSKGNKEFQYGRIEINAKLPSGRGIWPAIWMLGSNFNSVGWPACGELDIMEYVGYEPNIIYSTVHTPADFGVGGKGNKFNLSTCEEEFHTYGMLWTEEKIVFYIDNIENVVFTYSPIVKTSENWPFDQPAFFILNIAVGGNWGGAQGIDNSIFPQQMEIDYIRVYQE